jgi:hypothetical protein
MDPTYCTLIGQRHLINDGVEETPPSNGLSNGFSSSVAGPSPYEFFVNLEDTNVGFKHWHPTPVVQNGGKLSGQGELGGVWYVALQHTYWV